MRRCILVIILALAMSTAYSISVSADDKLSISDIMDKHHKGKEAPVQTILAGKADEALLKQFVAYYEFMGTQKPPVGDEAKWKEKNAKAVAALKEAIEKKATAAESVKAALNCKACHTDHKPKKEQK